MKKYGEPAGTRTGKRQVKRRSLGGRTAENTAKPARPAKYAPGGAVRRVGDGIRELGGKCAAWVRGLRAPKKRNAQDVNEVRALKKGAWKQILRREGKFYGGVTAAAAAHAASKGRYGSRKIKASLERSGVTVSRRRVCRIMRENGLAGAYGRKRLKVHPGAVNEADVANVVARGFGGRAPRTHICSDLTYVRVGASWNYVCLLVDLYNREIVGHSAGPRKDARLVKSAFATLSFPISDIEVFRTDRGCEFDNAEIDLMLEAFGIERSLSAKGCPYDNAVDESTNRILKAELVHRETFGTTRELQVKLADYVHWYNNFRMHSTLGYMTPVEFRKAGLVLPKSSKKM